jgi:4-amino-4-deoxy-L-arabinose transferase-like glycosyltransferase
MRFRVSSLDSGNLVLGGLIVGSMLVRIGVLALGGFRLQDPDNYLPLARSIAEGEGLAIHGRPTAYRPPLYPLVLAPLTVLGGEGAVLGGVAALHVALGAGTVWLVSVAAKGWGLGHRRALAAALVVAFDPLLLGQSRAVMTEPLAAFLLAAALALFAQPGLKGLLGGGLFCGLAGLCRPSSLAGSVLAVVGYAAFGPGPTGRRFAHSLALTLTIAAVLTPWAIRNCLVFGEPIWTTTHGGYTLALGNNETYYREVLDGRPGTVWSGAAQFAWFDEVNRATAGLTEPEADRFLAASVRELALAEPRRFIRACVERVRHFWSLAPAPAVYPPAIRLATACWNLPLLCAFVLGLVSGKVWRWPRVAAVAAIFGLSLIHTFYWTDLRMRSPVVPALALVAASAGMPRFLPRPPVSTGGSISGTLQPRS